MLLGPDFEFVGTEFNDRTIDFKDEGQPCGVRELNVGTVDRSKSRFDCWHGFAQPRPEGAEIGDDDVIDQPVERLHDFNRADVELEFDFASNVVA